jgi:hypothetical protein
MGNDDNGMAKLPALTAQQVSNRQPATDDSECQLQCSRIGYAGLEIKNLE